MSLSIVVRGLGSCIRSRKLNALFFKSSNGSISPINFDATNKLLTFDKAYNYVAALTFRFGRIKDWSVYSFKPEIEAAIAEDERITVEEFVRKMSTFFVEEWNKVPKLKNYKGTPIIFVVGVSTKGSCIVILMKCTFLPSQNLLNYLMLE